MLTLADTRTIGAFTVYRDTVFEAGQRSYTSTFYTLPDEPRLAQDAAGGPAFDFLWYRAPPGEIAVGAGGFLTLSVDLTPTPAELSALEEAVRAAYGLAPADEVQLLPVPVRAGTVTLAFAGETAGADGSGPAVDGSGDFAARIGGSGSARLAGWERAAFGVDLTSDGAALLWQAIQSGTTLLHARYDLVFDAHLDDVQLRVWCDVRASIDFASAVLADGPVDPARLREILTSQHVAGSELTSERPIPPEDRELLERTAQELLEAALASAILDGGSGRPGVRPYARSMEMQLNHTFTQSFPVERQASLDGFVRLDGGQLGDRVRKIDLDGGFFRVVEVKVFCTVDFQNDLIEAVKAAFVYDATGSSGPVHHQADLVFRDGVTVQTFRFAPASSDQRAYRYDVDVHYRGIPEPVRLSFDGGDATAVVLDLDRLGVLRVDVELRDVPLDIVRTVVVDLLHPDSGLSQRLILDGARPAGSWSAVVGGTSRTYRYRAAFVTDDGRVESDWAESSVPRLLLDCPAELLRRAAVRVVSAGDFSDLAQIVVDLREAPDAPDVASFAFAEPGQTALWEPRTAVPDNFRYQVRQMIVGRDGLMRQSDWIDDNRPVLVVRDRLQLEVTVVPQLLDLGASVKLAVVELSFDDTQGGIHVSKSLVIRDRSERPAWIVRLGDPARHTYRYRLTLIAGDGSQTESNWREARDAILVLRPGEE